LISEVNAVDYKEDREMKLKKTKLENTVRARQSGVTLIELMVVVVIIAIISAFAYPSYTQFVVKSKRGVGTSMLLQVADRQQQFFLDNKQYATDLTDLGFLTDPFMISEQGAYLVATSADRVYEISLSAATATTYTVTATPQLYQASKDTKCAKLSITHAGVKDASGPSDDCW